MATDCRIGARVEPITVYAGETMDLTMQIVDANNAPIDVSSFTGGPFTIYKGNDFIIQALTDVSFEGTNIKVRDKIRSDIRKDMTGLKYYFKCPVISPGGTEAIIHGPAKIDNNAGTA